MSKVIYDGKTVGISFKDVLATAIPALCAEDPDVIYLDADVMHCTGTDKWAAENPDRAINCGIAEANMIGVAAGLSTVGYKPLVHTFGVFASRRCYDQVFLSVGYAQNSVTVLGTSPGVTAANDGGTHMAFEDISLYRAIPDAVVLEASDPVMLRDLMKKCVNIKGVKYLRTGRKLSYGSIYAEGSSFDIGKAEVLREGDDAVVFASGLMVYESLKAADILSEEGIEITVVDMFSIKPLDTETVLRYSEKTGRVLVAENHNRVGGLTDAVAYALVGKCCVDFDTVSVNDEFGQVGPQQDLQQAYGLTAENVVRKIKAML